MRVHANRDSALVLAAQASKAVPKITTIPELKGIHMEADARLAMEWNFRSMKRRNACWPLSTTGASICGW